MEKPEIQILQAIAESYKMSVEQLEELKDRITDVAEDEERGGFGCVTIIIKNGLVYKLSHTLDGKPRVFRKIEDTYER
jgi:hypothetical protein